MIFSFLLIFVVQLNTFLSSHIRNEIIQSCLKLYQPDFALVFSCQTNADNVNLQKNILFDESIKTRIAIVQPISGILKKFNTSNYEKVTFFLDIDCDKALLILTEASNLDKFGKFSFLYSWFLITNANRFIPPFPQLAELKIRIDSNVQLFQFYKYNIYRIVDIFNPGINVGIVTSEVGHYSAGKIQLFLNLSYYESRKNLSGTMIRSAGVAKYPFKTTFHDYMIDLKYRYYDIYPKFHYQLFLVLKDIHKFNHNITRVSAWFGNKSSGEDGGIAKMLWDGTVDISSAGGMIRLLGSERVYFYDYIMPYYKFRSYFFFRNPGRVKANFYEVLKPFTKSTWMVTIYTVLILYICIEIASIMEDSNNKQRWCFNSVFMVIAAFCQQGLDRLPRRLASRIIVLHLFILSILLYNYYTSSLVSSLISTEPEVLKTIEELTQSDLQVGMELQPFTTTYILDRSKTDKALNKLNSSKIYRNSNKPNYWSVKEGVERVHEGGYAYLTEAIAAYPRIAQTFEQESICDLAAIPLLDTVASLMTQKKGPYKKLFQISLRKMWERGILHKLHKSWVGGKPQCLSSTRVISVGFNDLFLPYFLLIVGVIISLGILLGEVLWLKIRKWLLKNRRLALEFIK